MVNLKPITFQSILAFFKEIARQGFSSSYYYFHSLGYWTQATLDIELIAKVILFHILFMDDLKLFSANDNQLASFG